MSQELLQVGEDVLNTVISALNYSSVDSFNEDVKKVKEWLELQPHLPEIMDDKKIRNFLILNKGSVEITKEKIDNYYTMRGRLPEIFGEINPKLPYMRKNYDAFHFVPLPKLTPEMYRVFFFRVHDTDMKERFNPVHAVRYILNFQEVRLIEDVTYGDVFILDGKNAPLNFVLNITPSIIYTLLILIYKKVYSNRVKAVHVIHAPSFAERIMMILKPIIGAKVTRRIQFHHNYDFLTREFGKKMIPRDFGGEESSIEELHAMVVEKFQSFTKLFDGLDTLRVEEKLRPQKGNYDELCGLQGNFKKLEVD